MLAQGCELSQACGLTHTRPADVKVIAWALCLDSVKLPGIISEAIKSDPWSTLCANEL